MSYTAGRSSGDIFNKKIGRFAMNKRFISAGSFAFMLCLVVGFVVLWSVCCEAGWIRTYGGASPEYATSLARTSDGGYVLAGTTNDNCLVVKFDSVWNMAWQKTYGGSGTDVCGSIKQT